MTLSKHSEVCYCVLNASTGEMCTLDSNVSADQYVAGAGRRLVLDIKAAEDLARKRCVLNKKPYLVLRAHKLFRLKELPVEEIIINSLTGEKGKD